MSKMSQLHAELTEAAAELGFESIEEAEAHGYKVEYGENHASLVPDIDEAYKIEKEELERLEESKRVEMVYEAIKNAKDMIGLIYKPNHEPCVNAYGDIDDEKIKEYYYTLNDMCIELADRHIMKWQEEFTNEN